MKHDNALRASAVALFMMFSSANENKAQGNKPGGVAPERPKTEMRADSTAKNGEDTLRANFKVNNADADTGTKKKLVASPDMPLDDQASIHSINKDEIGIAIWKGKDMKKYTYDQMVYFYEKMCTDSGARAKVFIGDAPLKDGNTVYAVFVNGISVGGLMDGDEILDYKSGLPRAIRAQIGFDNRKRRAGISLTQD